MTDSPVTPRTGKPRTPEGRALLRDLWGAYAPRVESGNESVGTRIARIEEQAMTEGWDRGRAALASTPSTPDTGLTAERRERLFTEIDERFGRNVARFVDARLTEADR
jgi:hypothetical protein